MDVLKEENYYIMTRIAAKTQKQQIGIIRPGCYRYRDWKINYQPPNTVCSGRFSFIDIH
jgi:hypothetical protein